MRVKFDAFRFCRFLRVVGNVMIVAVLLLTGAVYFAVAYSYAPRVYTGRVYDKLVSLSTLTVFTFLCTMMLWAYFMTAFSEPGRVPTGWHPFATAEEEEAARAEALGGVVASLSLGDLQALRPRFCRKCRAWKPERAHHCSVMGRCVLKMDHFCVWVVNTVGLLNYKHFLLFLAYAALACVVAFTALLPAIIGKLLHDGASARYAGLLLMCTVLTFMFAVMLVAFLGMHWDMVAKNYTSVETIDYSVAAQWPHDHGLKRNFDEVFGRRRKWWWVPVLTRDDMDWLLAQALETSRQPLIYQSSAMAISQQV